MVKIYRACTILLRLMAMAAVITAAVVMATSRETTTYFNLTLKADFTQTPSFKFFLVANCIAALYSIFALFAPSAGLVSRWVIVFDVTIAMLLTSAMAAALAIAQVGKKGNVHAGWLPICDQVPKYCNHVMGALISGFVGLLFYTLIVFYTISTELNPLLPGSK
ncbi:CASP-like protein 1C1 [Phalaenopsis equestris]|uniref:CASP-like protein 1C1 n=1 Tax=Phalaenopsis equestris TaxID=78828 RepID=UPI0009E45047|nr:CASP-like protein 1C1 [Phalaenopsis equestris]